jgi:putative nucleotidyltransferase with HDIG domain
MNPGLIDVEALVRDAQQLDPLPASAARLAGQLSDHDWNLSEISETIGLDQALTGRLLSAANSVLSGSRHRIATIDQAVMRLGPGNVLSIALGASVSRQMKQALPEFGLSEGELWRHSVAAALAIEQARFFIKKEVKPEAFAAALLHDIGKLLLARHLDSETITFVQRACEEGGFSSEEAEREVLHVDHAELGALVTRKWSLPEPISLAIQYHHSPFSATDEASRTLCFQIALADAVATTLGVPCGESQPIPDFTPALAGSLGITEQGFRRLCAEVEARLDEVISIYG